MKEGLNFKDHGDINGKIAVNFANNLTLDDFCTEHIPNFSKERFEAFAIRVLLGNETIITIYAVDKQKQENSSVDTSKIPVKKFKLNTVPLHTLFSYCKSFNFTLTTGNYQLEDMEIINK